MGKKLGFTSDRANFHNVSLGQGQEVVAEEAMDISASQGHWVVLQVSYTYYYLSVIVYYFIYKPIDPTYFIGIFILCILFFVLCLVFKPRVWHFKEEIMLHYIHLTIIYN